MNGKSTTSTAPEGLSEAALAAADSFESPARFTREMAEEGRHLVGEVEVRRGRGRPAMAAADRKEKVTLRLSPEVLAAFRAGGEGWQTRIDEALKTIVQSGTLDEAKKDAPEKPSAWTSEEGVWVSYRSAEGVWLLTCINPRTGEAVRSEDTEPDKANA